MHRIPWIVALEILRNSFYIIHNQIKTHLSKLNLVPQANNENNIFEMDIVTRRMTENAFLHRFVTCSMRFFLIKRFSIVWRLLVTIQWDKIMWLLLVEIIKIEIQAKRYGKLISNLKRHRSKGYVFRFIFVSLSKILIIFCPSKSSLLL